MKNFIKKINWNKILFVIMTLLVGLFSVFVGVAHILPMKYYVMMLVVFFLWLLILYFLLVFKTKKGKNKPRKITGYIVSLLLLVIMVLVFYYLNNTLDFFKRFGSSKFKEENYIVMVLKNSEYAKIDDINNKNIGYVPNELSKINDALHKLDEIVTLEKKSYEGHDQLFTDLIDKQIAAVLIEESRYNIIEENGEYKDMFKIIYSFVVKSEIDEVSKDVDVTSDTFTIYISGIDKFGSINAVSRSDVNMLVTVNPKTKQILLVSIPRDYYVKLKGTTGHKDKLTHAGLYGIETSIGTIEDLLNVDINYYFRVNFTTLQKVIDALDGVDVYSKYEFTTTENYHFFKGYNHMNGKEALTFSRERYALPGGDRSRGQNQQAVIDGIVKKLTSSAIITKYNNILDSLKDTFQTNMTDKDILKLIRMQLDDMAKWNITSYSLDGTDGSEYTYSYPSGKLYVMYPKENTINEAISLIGKVKDGEKLTGSYGEASNVKDPTIVAPKPVVPETPVVPDPQPDDNVDTPTVPDIPGMPDNPEVPDVPSDDTTEPSTDTPDDTVDKPEITE